MISYDKFRKLAKERIHAYLPAEYQDYRLVETRLYRINHMIDSVCLQPPHKSGPGAMPSFQMQDLYRRVLRGEEPEDTVRAMAALFEEAMHNFTEPPLLDLGKDDPVRRETVQLALINRSRNRRLLEKTPHRDFLDLAAVAVALTKVAEGHWYTCLIDDGMREAMGLPAEELLKLACDNTFRDYPVSLKGEGGLLSARCEGSPYGAACLLDAQMLQETAERLDSDLYVLPDCLQAILIHSSDLMDEPEVVRHFRLIQAIGTDPEEYLSNTPYRYERETGRLRLCRESA